MTAAAYMAHALCAVEDYHYYQLPLEFVQCCQAVSTVLLSFHNKTDKCVVTQIYCRF